MHDVIEWFIDPEVCIYMVIVFHDCAKAGVALPSAVDRRIYSSELINKSGASDNWYGLGDALIQPVQE